MRITIDWTRKILYHDYRSRFDDRVELDSSTSCSFIAVKPPPATVNQPKEQNASKVYVIVTTNIQVNRRLRLEGSMAGYARWASVPVRGT
jgi:hypothetical protein